MLYAVCFYHTHPLRLCFREKTKVNPRMSGGRRNVSSSLGHKKEQSEEMQRRKALGQRSSPCYGQSSQENLWFWGDAAVRVLAGLQHSSLVQNIQISVTVHVLCLSLWERPTCRSCIVAFAFIVSSASSHYYCVCVCTILHFCVFDSVCSVKHVGPCVWEQRGGVNECMDPR